MAFLHVCHIAVVPDQQDMSLCSYAVCASLNDIILHSINFGHEFDCICVCVCVFATEGATFLHPWPTNSPTGIYLPP